MEVMPQGGRSIRTIKKMYIFIVLRSPEGADIGMTVFWGSGISPLL